MQMCVFIVKTDSSAEDPCEDFCEDYSEESSECTTLQLTLLRNRSLDVISKLLDIGGTELVFIVDNTCE